MFVTDHLGRRVSVPNEPKRIISFVPSLTETMYHLGLEQEIVGRTRFCKFPTNKVKQAVNIGGTKDMKLERIHELQPDLIIAEKEENTKEMVEILEQHYPVFVFEIQHFKEVFRMISDLGKLTNRELEAAQLAAEIKTAFQALPHVGGKRAGYVIWQNPYMVVGKDTYIHSVLEEMGYVNPFISFEGRYPAVTAEDFQQAELDELLLATEPFPFQEKHLEQFQTMLPHVNIRIIDGEMFWSGAKMKEAAAYFATFIENGTEHT